MPSGYGCQNARAAALHHQGCGQRRADAAPPSICRALRSHQHPPSSILPTLPRGQSRLLLLHNPLVLLPPCLLPCCCCCCCLPPGARPPRPTCIFSTGTKLRRPEMTWRGLSSPTSICRTACVWVRGSDGSARAGQAGRAVHSALPSAREATAPVLRLVPSHSPAAPNTAGSSVSAFRIRKQYSHLRGPCSPPLPQTPLPQLPPPSPPPGTGSRRWGACRS